MNSAYKKYIYLSLVVALMAVVGVFLYLSYMTADLTIRTEDGADIYVSQDRASDFEKIGTTEVTFKTRTYGVVFVRVSKGEAVTERSVELDARGSQAIEVVLKELSGSERLLDKSFSYPYFQGSFVYGINPGTRSLSFENRVDDQLPEHTFIDVPYVDKVVWESAGRFVYRSPIEGVGVFINGEPSPPPYPNEGTTRYFDFTKHEDQPLILLDETGLYATDEDSLGSNSVERIAEFSFDGDASLFADENYIYFANSTFESDGGEGGNPALRETTVTVFNYQGEEKYGFATNEHPQTISQVIDLGNETFLALGERDVLTLNKDTGEVAIDSFYFDNTHDLLAVGEDLYVLSSAGLWQYDHQSASFYKVAGYPEDEEYVKHSLTFSPGSDALIYSTSPKLEALREGKPVQGGVHRVDLR